MGTEEKWNAVLDSNTDYDGLFYYAVKTTGIFCRPSCRAKMPLKKNIVFFDNAEEALKEGFRPCKMCRPDLNGSHFHPNKELIKTAKDIFDASYNKSFDLDGIASNLGLSKRHLMRLFKNSYGMTPNEYIQVLRIRRSKILLNSTDKEITDIAYEAGFESMSNFYKCFKKQVKTTPKKYRDNNIRRY